MTDKLEELERYNWQTNEYRRIKGTDDWVRVADLGEEDLQNGSRMDLLRSWESFTKEHEYTFRAVDYIEGVASIKAFRVPE